MKFTMSSTLMFVLFTNILFSQGNYRNTLPSNFTPVKVLVSDIETIPNHIMITGLCAPYANNPNLNTRIFFTDYTGNGMYPFNKIYLHSIQDFPSIDFGTKFIVKEVKHLSNGFIFCGQIQGGSGISSYSQGFVMKTSLNGNCVWAKRYDIPNSKSIFFHSIQPVTSAFGSITKYVTCGYRQINSSTRRAIVICLDSLGNPVVGAKQIIEAPVNGKEQSSEFTKVIRYNAKYCALTGYCGQVKDSCNDIVQSGTIFSMYEVNNYTLYSKSIQTLPGLVFDKKIDEGVSLVKTDSGVIVLSKYYDGNNLPCGALKDHQTKLTLINPVLPNALNTWIIAKTLRYNAHAANTSLEEPRDLLYEANSPNILRVYGNYLANLGYLLHFNFNTGNHLSAPMVLNNHVGQPSTDGKTIDFNTANHVVGITNLSLPQYSLFEVTPSFSWNCLADTIPVKFFADTLNWVNLNHDSLVLLPTMVPITTLNLAIHDSIYCDSVWAKSRPNSTIVSEEITLHPNPASNYVHIDINPHLAHAAEFLIIDMHGKILLRKSIAANTTSFSLPLNDYPKGNYVVKILSHGDMLFSDKLTIYSNL